MTRFCATSEATRRRIIGLGVAALVVLTLTAYWPAMGGGFIWDDELYIVKDPLINGSSGLQRIWFTTESRDYYPVTLSLFWTEWRLWGTNTFGYHLVNVVLHLVNTLLLWWLLAREGLRWSWLAATLFALHPVNVPSVAWICEAKNLLAMLGSLVCLLCYRRHEHTHRAGWYIAALLAFGFALLSKPSVVMLPVVLLGHAWWQTGRIRGDDLRRSVPLFLMSAVFGILTLWFQHHRALVGAQVLTAGSLERLAGAGWAVWFYLAKAVLPVGLSMVYEPWTLDFSSRMGWLPLGFLFVLGWCLARSAHQWARATLFAVGCYVAMLFPMLGFFDQGYYGYALVADHWQYFSLPAIAALGAAALGTLAVRNQYRVVAALAAIILVSTWFVGTRARSRVFRSDEAMWRDTVQRSPSAGVAHLNFANDLARRGEDVTAIAYYFRALAIQPDNDGAHYNLAIVLARCHHERQAARHLARACVLRPSAERLVRLGGLLMEQGQQKRAAICYTEAMSVEPQSAAAAEARRRLEALKRTP